MPPWANITVSKGVPVHRGLHYLSSSLSCPIRIIISRPDRASIAQHGRDKPRISARPRRLSERPLPVVRAWPRHIPCSLSVPRPSRRSRAAGHPVALQGPLAQSHGWTPWAIQPAIARPVTPSRRNALREPVPGPVAQPGRCPRPIPSTTPFSFPRAVAPSRRSGTSLQRTAWLRIP